MGGKSERCTDRGGGVIHPQGLRGELAHQDLPTGDGAGAQVHLEAERSVFVVEPLKMVHGDPGAVCNDMRRTQ